VIKNFEQVSFFSNPELEVTAIIAVHNTILGPGLGGCRLRSYDSVDQALEDVLRLAEGMSYKSSLAGLNLGGAKSVIISSQKALKNREELFLQFGKWVDSLNGKYIAAEDMGTSVEDIKIMSRVTKHLSGTDPEKGGGGDPSPFTARGVYLGIGACLERVFASSKYENKKVLIQGLGHVGLELAKLLYQSGAKLIVAETHRENLIKARELFEFEVCDVNQVYQTECDVFAPCAIGAILNPQTIPQLKCKIVAGAANNQLLSAADEFLLKEKGIIYAPDFAINSGGVIMCAGEFEKGGYKKVWVDNLVNKVGDTVGQILDESKRSGKLAGEVAIDLAKLRIEASS
jgi:leucine dehydrogenase